MTGPLQIAQKTVRFYRENLSDCLLFGLLSQSISIIGLALSPLKRLLVLSENLSPEWLSEHLGQTMTIGITSVLWLIINFWLYLLIAGALARFVWKRDRNEEAHAVSSTLQTFDQGGPLLWANLLTGLIIGAAALFTSIMFFLYKTGASESGGGFIISLLLSVAMGGVVFLCLKFSLVTAVVLFEGRRGMHALNRSWFLMTGREFDAFMLFTLLFAIFLLFGMLMGVLQGGDMNTTPNPDAPSWSLLENLIGIIIAPLFPIGITQFYQTIIADQKG
ncbi:MAG: hypothetical protein AAB035_03105 [Nitrospirota bacterium]